MFACQRPIRHQDISPRRSWGLARPSTVRSCLGRPVGSGQSALTVPTSEANPVTWFIARRETENPRQARRHRVCAPSLRTNDADQSAETTTCRSLFRHSISKKRIDNPTSGGYLAVPSNEPNHDDYPLRDIHAANWVIARPLAAGQCPGAERHLPRGISGSVAKWWRCPTTDFVVHGIQYRSAESHEFDIGCK